MIWRLRSRSRTICLALALAAASLYLLLLLASHVYLRPCDTLLPHKTHILRELAHRNFSPVGVTDPHGADAPHGDSASRDARGKLKGHADPPASAESGLSKLEALFNHPLYNLPQPPIPEEDQLLKVRAKVKTSEWSSQMWLRESLEDEGVPWSGSSGSHPPWLRFHLGISRWQLYPHRDPNMELLMQQLATHKIVSAVQKSGGTQLKLVMSFPNYGQAMFKPMKQERDEETSYNLYYFSDFERHNAEIAAFHLDRYQLRLASSFLFLLRNELQFQSGILGYRRIPPVVGRLVDVVREIKNVTTDRKLARTFFTSPVGSVCFYGRCSYYCSTEHAVCGRPTGLEASLAVMLPDLSLATRRSWKSPWRRSYSRSKLAKWETQPSYCTTVKKKPPYDEGTRLVDFMDMVILDFLMSMFAVCKKSDWVFIYQRCD